MKITKQQLKRIIKEELEKEIDEWWAGEEINAWNVSSRDALKFSKGSDAKLRRRAARSTYAPPEVLKRLTKDSDVGVRREVAYNPATPLEVLAILATDPDEGVRWAVLAHDTTPDDLRATIDALPPDNDGDEFPEV